MQETDVAIVGGGIVGLATGWQISSRRPDLSLVVLEKEGELATHQTGHNSGVIHSGIYYRPGSLKAVNCRHGKQALQEFCDQHGIGYEICGKVIVATTAEQRSQLHSLFRRGQENGVRCTLIGPERLSELEPHVAGVAAIEVHDTGIVDFRQVCFRLAREICRAGNRVQTDWAVRQIVRADRRTVLESSRGSLGARLVVNCAGLHCDRVARMLGGRSRARIVPFRGEYWSLTPSRRRFCRNLIYPLPDPRFPFLGVHLTRMLDGAVHCGPNAVPALAREGYRKTAINPGDLKSSLLYPGFWRLAARHAVTGVREIYRSFSKRAFVAALQKLVPEIQADDLQAAGAGVRAQAVMPDGKLVDDFLIEEMPNAVSVLNAPSPAATAALNIGKLVADRVLRQLD